MQLGLALVLLGLFAMWTMALRTGALAWRDRCALRQLWLRFAPLDIREGDLGVGAVRGKVESRGPDRVFAVHEVMQLGRARPGPAPSIAFRDVGSASRCLGGFVAASGISLRIGADDSRVSVWTLQTAREQAAACTDAFSFAAALLGARSGNGMRRTVTTALRAGDPIVVAGEVLLEDRKVAIRAPAGEPLILASFDPRPTLQRQRRLIDLFLAAGLLAGALCTALVLWPPLFGAVSWLGAALCLGFFLGVGPVGSELHRFCQPPDRAPLDCAWTCASREERAPEQLIELG